MAILAWILVGIMAGVLGATGLGIVGAVLGGFLGSMITGADWTTGFNVSTIVVTVVGALIALFAYNAVAGRRVA
jgi:uncharacterized membrane protein YeaQ/YmgE (transglycosylase-associated protein family)